MCEPHRTDDIVLQKDGYVLHACAAWQMARASLLTLWAQNDQETMFGYRGDPLGWEANSQQVAIHGRKLNEAIQILEANPPHTMGGAQALLNVMLEIMAVRSMNDESRLAAGDLLKMLRGLKSALDYVPTDTLIGPQEGTAP